MADILISPSEDHNKCFFLKLFFLIRIESCKCMFSINYVFLLPGILLLDTLVNVLTVICFPDVATPACKTPYGKINKEPGLK